MDEYPEIHVEIPVEAWRPVGQSETEDKTTGQLLSTLVVRVGRHSVHLHVDAVAVEDTDGQPVADDAVYTDDDLGFIHNAVGADGHWDIVEINGREYVLIATPYC